MTERFMRRNIHITAQVVDHVHFVAALFAGLFEPPRRIERGFLTQNGDFHSLVLRRFRGSAAGTGTPARKDRAGSI